MQNRTMRDELKLALASLSDGEVQERLWRRGERHNNEELGFNDAVLVVIDELPAMYPNDLVGSVLRDETELEAFMYLQTALEAVVEAIGEHGEFDDARKLPGLWENAVSAAKELRARLDA